MKSAVESLSPTRVKMTVEVPTSELQPHLDSAYRTIGQQVQVPGFRRGKVPARIIDQRIGRGAVIQEAVNEALPQFYSQALAENQVQALGQPDVEITEVPVEDGQQLAFVVETDVRPEITLPDLEGIELTVDPVRVADEDVQTKLDELRERFGTLVGVEREVGEGDFVSISLAARIGEEEVDSVSGVSYEVGSGTMLPGLDEALTGLSAGESADFTAPLAGGEHAGQDADCTVTVEAVKVRQLPELDDDFAQLASEFDTLAELRADVVEQVEQDQKFHQGVQARDALMEHLLAAVEIPVPDGVVQAEVTSHLENEDRLADDEHRSEVDESTRAALRTQFLLDAIATQREVEVTQQDLIEYLVMSAQQYGMDPNQFAQMMDQRDQVPAMAGEVARRKALASVLDDAVISDSEGTSIDLNELVPNAEDGEGGEDSGDEPSEAAADDATSGASSDSGDSSDSSDWSDSSDSSDSGDSGDMVAESSDDTN